MKLIFAIGALALGLVLHHPARCADAALTFTTVEGAGGVPLNVVETGNPAGKEILFIHGMSASYLTWLPQLRSTLGERYRLVAFDMRGHGGSGKPWRGEDYAGPQVWADDIAAVIAAKHLNRPVLATWSFGGHAALAYIRQYGLAHVAGLNLAGTLAGLLQVDHTIQSPKYKAMLAASALRASRDLEQNIEGYRQMAKGYPTTPLDPKTEDLVFLSGLMHPAYVRRAQTNLPVHNEDMGPKLAVPVVIAVGTDDEEWPVDAVKKAAAMLPQATVSVYPGKGHYVSAEDTVRYNRELTALVEQAR
jgi:pimeloyl-ACP methyl ester carboxylesterase